MSCKRMLTNVVTALLLETMRALTNQLYRITGSKQCALCETLQMSESSPAQAQHCAREDSFKLMTQLLLACH